VDLVVEAVVRRERARLPSPGDEAGARVDRDRGGIDGVDRNTDLPKLRKVAAMIDRGGDQGRREAAAAVLRRGVDADDHGDMGAFALVSGGTCLGDDGAIRVECGEEPVDTTVDRRGPQVIRTTTLRLVVVGPECIRVIPEAPKPELPPGADLVGCNRADHVVLRRHRVHLIGS